MNSGEHSSSLKAEKEADKRSTKEKIYLELFNKFKTCGYLRYAQTEANKFWATVKALPLVEIQEGFSSKMKAMEEKRKKGSITALFDKTKKKQTASSVDLTSDAMEVDVDVSGTSQAIVVDHDGSIPEPIEINEEEVEADDDPSQAQRRNYPTPAEDKARKCIFHPQQCWHRIRKFTVARRRSRREWFLLQTPTSAMILMNRKMKFTKNMITITQMKFKCQ